MFFRAAAICLAAAAVAASAQARKPKNPRWGKKPARRAAVSSPVAIPSEDAAPAAAPGYRLAPGRWRTDVRAALERLGGQRGRGAPGYDPMHPPVAILSFDDSPLLHDIGTAVFRRMVERADFKFGDAFWREVPLAFGRQRLRSELEMFIDLPVSVWEQQPAYRRYRKGFLRAYRDMCAERGRLECRAWLVKLLRGYAEEEITAYTMATLGEEYLREPMEEFVRDAPDDPDPVVVRRGLARVPEMAALCRFLQDAGFDLWAMAATDQGQLEVVAREFDIDPARVRGIRGGVYKEKRSAEILLPLPYRGGKAEIVSSQIAEPPALIIGVGADDQELLALPGGPRVLIGGEGEDLRRLAVEKEWLMQPAFEAPRRP